MSLNGVLSFRNVLTWWRRYGAVPLWRHDAEIGDAEGPWFILGSGASINRYQDWQWRLIEDGVSVGLNYWVFHDFVLDILMFELYGIKEAFFRVLRARYHEYRSTTLIIKGNYLPRRYYPDFERVWRLIPAILRPRTFVSFDFPVPGHTPSQFEWSIGALARMGFFDRSSWRAVGAQSRATVGFAVNYAIQRGCRDIVLCGIDLNNTDYFYADDPTYLAKWNVSGFDHGQRGAVHLTDDPSHSMLTISSVLKATEKLICRPRGIRLSVGSRLSALHPALPCFFDERPPGDDGARNRGPLGASQGSEGAKESPRP